MAKLDFINADRITWRCNDRGITAEELAGAVGLPWERFKKALAAGAGLTFIQLRKIAEFFNRSTLFFLESGPVTAAQVHTPQFRTRSKVPDCAMFLRDAKLDVIEVDSVIANQAIEIKKLLGIVDDAYDPRGVGENDILIVAPAKVRRLELVSEESPQIKQPRQNCRLKVPRVCGLPKVGVNCISFIELIRRSNRVFE